MDKNLTTKLTTSQFNWSNSPCDIFKIFTASSLYNESFCVSRGCGCFMITHWGCVLYTVPSTPTVTLKTLWFRFCLIRVRMADSPAATRLEDLKDTMVLTCCTAMQSSWDGLKPRFIKTSLVFFRPFLYLKKSNIKINVFSFIMNVSKPKTGELTPPLLPRQLWLSSLWSSGHLTHVRQTAFLALPSSTPPASPAHPDTTHSPSSQIWRNQPWTD